VTDGRWWSFVEKIVKGHRNYFLDFGEKNNSNKGNYFRLFIKTIFTKLKNEIYTKKNRSSY